ncbi:MAG: TIGR03986 family CRISPR-associated RAMP protein [Campylobacter sp.]|nr:TIGR03986 family CRISPR-associated RAMP protein [Campylobacter sp.]
MAKNYTNTKGFNQGRNNDKKEKLASNEPAFAPYNFVSLNDDVITDSVLDLELDSKNKIISGDGFSKFHKDHFSGYIELEIKNLTPLFIGDSLKEQNNGKNNATLNKKESQKATKQKDDKEITKQEFFSINGKEAIPGSSIRGMVRNLVEIASYSKFQFFNDNRFFYRDVAGVSKNSLKVSYEKIMKKECKNNNEVKQNDKNKKNFLPKADCGILVRENDKEFYIIKTTYETKKFLEPFENKNMPEFEINKKYDYSEKYDYFEVFTGKIGSISKDKKKDNRKKVYYKVKIPKNKNEKINLYYRRDILPYVYDSQPKFKRGGFLNLIEKLNEKIENDKLRYPNGIPCFYVKDGENVYFGHTPYFRIPYKHRVRDLISQSYLDKNDGFDMAEAIFGKDGAFASRVFFEDANSQNKARFEEKEILLSMPKPTSFNLYLEQNDGNISNQAQMKHYDDDTKIRGYKMYHHKEFSHFITQKQRENKKIIKKINAMREGAIFKGKIRFENLNATELGALIFVLDLPDGCYHKIGMAKPLGMGSIEIKPRLILHDISKRYEKVFDKNGDFFEPKISDKNMGDFKQNFEEYILSKIKSDKKSIWDEVRMQELKTMLRYGKQGDFDYMGLRSTNKKNVLPHAKDINENHLIFKNSRK